jgi:hypothetical protein
MNNRNLLRMNSTGNFGTPLPEQAQQRLKSALLRHGFTKVTSALGINLSTAARGALGMGLRAGSRLMIVAGFDRLDDLDRLTP